MYIKIWILFQKQKTEWGRRLVEDSGMEIKGNGVICFEWK